jgi:GTPase subunit of restriction endonuclease
MPSLNQIFFGPPGTGKTYATVEATLQILDQPFLASNPDDRTAWKKRFDELLAAGDVRFVTFHQSFSYEDFVEGLRATTDEHGELRYEVVSGIFKSLCFHTKPLSINKRNVKRKPRYFKRGDVYGSGYKVTRATADVVEIQKPQGKKLEIGMSLFSTLASHVRSGSLTLNDLGNGEWSKKLPDSSLDPFLINGYKNIIPIMVGHMVGQDDNGKELCYFVEEQSYSGSNKVLIIDEINRGNVSRIFGELITLLEPSKRKGASEALEVTLPYSKERFSIPNNVYLIGTMNTADRSLASMDIALRRRFTFIEVPPSPELLAGVQVEGVPIDDLLRVLNLRIEALLDRDHRLGHAYFLPLKSAPNLDLLESIFRGQILPLLQEYFFEDWQRIQWVLNDQRKSAENQFLIQPEQDLIGLFGDSVPTSHNGAWSLNPDAFERVEAYLGIIDHLAHAKPTEAFKEVEEDGIKVRRLVSGTIEVFRDGVRVKTAMPVLKELAKKYGIALEFETGRALNTRHLGARVIKALNEAQR